jgi:hypothetical protein
MELDRRQSSTGALLIPIDKPPKGQTVAVLLTSIILFTLAVIAVALRLWTRAFIVRSLGRDDIVMFIGVVSNKYAWFGGSTDIFKVFFGVFCGVITTLCIIGGFGDALISYDTLTLTTNVSVLES